MLWWGWALMVCGVVLLTVLYAALILAGRLNKAEERRDVDDG